MYTTFKNIADLAEYNYSRENNGVPVLGDINE
jgi:hypothetical protein